MRRIIRFFTVPFRVSSRRKFLRWIITAFFILLIPVIIISVLEATGRIQYETPIFTSAYNKILFFGMDGSLWSFFAIIKTIILIVPLWIIKYTEISIITLVQAGASFYKYPLYLVFLLLVCIAEVVFWFVIIPVLFSFQKTKRKEERKQNERFSLVDKASNVKDFSYKNFRFEGKVYKGKPVLGHFVSDKGYRVPVRFEVIKGQLTDHYDIDSRIEYPFGVTYKGGIEFDPSIMFWVPRGRGRLEGDVQIDNLVDGELRKGIVQYKNKTFYYDVSAYGNLHRVSAGNAYEHQSTHNLWDYKLSLYERRTSPPSNVQKHDIIEDRYISVTYNGDLRNLVPDGKGTLSFRNIRCRLLYSGQYMPSDPNDKERFITGVWSHGKLIERTDYIKPGEVEYRERMEDLWRLDNDNVKRLIIKIPPIK